jgi:hypothetical protein
MFFVQVFATPLSAHICADIPGIPSSLLSDSYSDGVWLLFVSTGSTGREACNNMALAAAHMMDQLAKLNEM